MTREEVKKLLPIIKAFSEGETIQHLDIINNKWEDVDEFVYHGSVKSYRIKPESKYRPFKNAEECWAEMLKHEPFGWVKMKDTGSGYYMIKGIASQVVFGFNETPFSYKRVFEDYTFADGTSFGVKVEE